jgi:PAS domain S-box-containing protein
VEGILKSISRFFEWTLSGSVLSDPESIPQQWTRDLLRLLIILAIPATVIISAFIFTGTLQLKDFFPIHILCGLSIIFWILSQTRFWKWARPFPALICFILGAYGIFALGVHLNIVLYFALAVIIAGLLQNMTISLVYVLLSTTASVVFGILLSDHPSDITFSTAIIITPLTTFFCLLGISLLDWYIKNRYQRLIAFQISNTEKLKEEIKIRLQLEEIHQEQEKQLRVSEEKFSKAFLISPDSVNINRLSDGVYVDVNQGFTKLMGFTGEDVLGKSSLELDIWSDPTDRERLVKGLRENGEVVNLEARFKRKSGDVGVGLMSARILEINNETCILSITRDITERKRQELQLLNAHADLELAYDATLQGWVKALEMREKETANHSRRVVDMTLKIAAAVGVAEDEMIHIKRGAMLHDIGKMGVPDHILLKPGPLTNEEWQIMRLHPNFAHNLLSEIDYLLPAIDIPYCHHEKWDGSGYPRGLKEAQIPLPARIFAIVDVFDALISSRPYRPAWSEKQALDYIQDQGGAHFDPDLIKIFMLATSAADISIELTR